MPTPRIENLNTDRIASIMSVALKEFAENNYHKSSFNRIIKNCGMSKGTMYYYFKNKQDLFLTLLHSITRDFKPLVEKPSTNPESPGAYWAEANRLLGSLMKLMYQKKTLGQFIRSFLTIESRHSPGPSAAMVSSIEDWLENSLLTGQLVGAVRRDVPVDLLIQMIWSIWETTNLWLQESLTDLNAEESSDIMLDFIKRALLPYSAMTDQAPQQEGL